jgi:RNA polymerase I-specific transcription initiation factor RRN7
VELYLKSLQLILRHQLWFLVHERGLPVELETVVHDLWALRILQFEGKITSERQEFDSSQAVPTSESETDGETNSLAFENRKKKLKDTPNVMDSLVLCYLGIVTLRLPVTPGDMYAWTTDGKLAYRRAIKLLPAAMRERLPAYYHVALDPNSLLSLRRFYSTLIDLEVGFEKEFGILWPPLNSPVLLFRYLKELALPLELYDASIRLGSLLEYDFALHTDGKTALGIRHVPEAQLIACLVVCVKLFYPFDGERRYPKSTSEPAATAMSWGNWCTIISNAKLKSREGDSRYTMEELTKLEEKDVLSMTGNQIDQYLDFYLGNFLDETHIEANEASDNFHNALCSMFPVTTSVAPQKNRRIDGTGSEKQLETVRAVQGRMRTNPVVAEGEEGSEIQRPGQSYVSYKKESNLPEHADVFFEEVARVAGLSLDMLVMAVFYTERRVEKWRTTRPELKKSSVR